jgi:E3 ubiquitin-protein ligase NRDP1
LHGFDFSRWSVSLQLARVTRWGGMISTPDAVLQAVIKRALLESGCPINITNDLMENAHERHWPQGLSTLGNVFIESIYFKQKKSSRNSTIE